MDEMLKKIQQPDTIIAVVGASNNPEKYGYKVFKDLLDKGMKVFPVNLNEEMILEQESYPSLSFLPDRPDIVVFVIPPEASLKVVEEVKNMGLDNLWFQPGASNQQVTDTVEKLGLNYSADECIMVKTSK